jgi:CRP-like cAMP-binding protein
MDQDRVKAVPLFAGLSRRECKALAPQADEIDLEEGYTLVRQGDWAYEFFAIEEGTVEVRRGDQLLAELGPGDFFGEMGLMADTRRNATVKATSPVKVVVMTAQNFRHTAREHPEVAAKIQAAIEERCRALEAVN